MTGERKSMLFLVNETQFVNMTGDCKNELFLYAGGVVGSSEAVNNGQMCKIQLTSGGT